MDWVARDQVPLEQVVQYEARLNYFMPTFGCTIICVYDARRTPPGMISDVLATHPMVIVNGMLRRNTRYVAPDPFLMSLRQREV
jgi:hypothetical protein